MRDNIVIWYNMIWYMMRDNIVIWYDMLWHVKYYIKYPILAFFEDSK